MDYISIGKRIKFERIKTKLTQAELAEKSNITTAFVGQIERGETKLSLETLVNIANVLEVSVDYILRDNVKTNSSSAIKELLLLVENRTAKDIVILVDLAKALYDNFDKNK
jgi:transcriptional regulator with XRE-family HTH domain